MTVLIDQSIEWDYMYVCLPACIFCIYYWHFLHVQELCLMQPSATLINIARGKVGPSLLLLLVIQIVN